MRKKTPTGRYFLSQKQIREGRRTEAVQHSIAKREGRKIVGVTHHQCGCGCGIFTTAAEEVGVSLPKQSKGQRKKNVIADKQCIHFRGKAIV